MFYLAEYLILYCMAHTSILKVASSLPEVEALANKNAMYKGAQVWGSKMRSSSDIGLVKTLMDNEDISMWRFTPDRALYLVLSKDKLKVHRALSDQGLDHMVVVTDVQKRIQEQTIGKPVWDKTALRRGHRMKWKQYPNIEVIDEYMDYLSVQYPSICKIEVIGYSAENSTIKMMKVSNGNPRNKGILVVSGIHGREWIAITSALFILREIVCKFDEQPQHVKNTNWYIVPLLNPDGYKYTYTQDRFWRKNRRPMDKCYGADLNRNFEQAFDIPGITDKQPCHEVYSGPYPFSEPETLALGNLVIKIKNNLHGLMDLHSFGQLIIFPWAWTAERTPDFKLQNSTASKIHQAIVKFNKKNTYKYGQVYHVIYPASGSLLDWSYSTGIPHSYVIEGRDRGAQGFLIESSQIQGAGQEMLEAVKALSNVINTENQTPEDTHRYGWF